MEHLIPYVNLHPWLSLFAVVAAAAVIEFERRWYAQSQAAVSPQQAIRLMNQGALVVDIRDAASFAAGHINGARNVSGEDIAAGAESLKRWREKQIVVCCERGVTGHAAVRTLGDHGFTKVLNLRGGLAAWRAENLPLAKS